MQIQEQSAIEITRIKQLIVKAGDEGADYFKRDLLKLAEELTDYYLQNRLELRDAIVKYMQEAISLLPMKAGVYATVVALLSTKQATHALADQIIQQVVDQLQHIWEETNPVQGKNTMTFLGELMNIGLINSVNYIECLYDLESGAEQESSPFYLHILLATIPHVIIKAMEKNQIEFKNIIQNIENLMNKRKKQTDLDELDLLWQAIKRFQNSGLSQQDLTLFLQQSYPRPYFLFGEEMLQIKQIRKNFKIQVNKRDKVWLSQQIMIFKNDSILEDQKVFMMQEIIRQWIHDTITLFKTNKMLLILQFDHYSKSLGLSPIQESTLKKLTTQTLVNKMIDLTPRGDDMPSVFYSSLLISLAQKENKNDYLEYLEQAIEECFIYHSENFIIMDLVSDLLSHFLSNISLKWNWDKLYGLITGDEREATFAKNYFVYQLLRKLFQMITKEKLKELLPKELLAWYSQYPDWLQHNTESRFNEEQINIQLCDELLQTKTASQEVHQKISDLSNGSNETYAKLLEIFTERLVLRMTPSITHLNVLTKRYHFLYTQTDILNRSQVQVILLQSLFHVWSHSNFHLRVYMQEWINGGMLSIHDALQWAIDTVVNTSTFTVEQFQKGSSHINLVLSLHQIQMQKSWMRRNGGVEDLPVEDLKLEDYQYITDTLGSKKLVQAM